MSGMRDGLNEWALGPGSEIAERLSGNEYLAREAIQSRKRRRVGLIVAGTAAAVVGMVSIASAMPEPAPVQPTVTDAVNLVSLTCGEPWTLAPGTTIHDDVAASYFGGVAGDWVLMTDSGDTVTNPTSLAAGFESLSWHGTPTLNGSVGLRALAVAERDGMIVGSFAVDYTDNFTASDHSIAAYAPYPGQCNQITAAADSGDYTYHLVIGAFRAGDLGAPLAMVVDPSPPLTVAVHGLTEWSAPADATMAQLEEPVGDTYQAFVVPRPVTNSCTPYSDMMDAGTPGSLALTYSVTIPEVQRLSGELWGNRPLVIIDDEDYNAWYVGLRTGVTAQSVSGGNPLGTLEWTTGPAMGERQHAGALRLVNTIGAQPLPGIAPDCAFTLPMPTISGAVFLIIDGVDAETLSELNPGADLNLDSMQTWVYLGQAS